MKRKKENFEISVPNLEGTDVERKLTVKVPLDWDEEFGQWVMSEEAHRIIDDAKAQAMGLLLPAQLKELRERFGLTQKEMGELFQVGEKSWTRWESGKHRASRVINLLIRSLYDGQISINYLLERAGKSPVPEPEAVGEDWSKLLLHEWKGPMNEFFGAVFCSTDKKPAFKTQRSVDNRSVLADASRCLHSLLEDTPSWSYSTKVESFPSRGTGLLINEAS